MQKTKRRIESRNTLAPLAASPAGTVTLGSGLDIAANVDVIQMKHGTTVFQKHQRSMRGGTSGRASARLLHSSHRLCAREQFCCLGPFGNWDTGVGHCPADGLACDAKNETGLRYKNVI
jgi:hypothetical protein